MLPLSDPSDLEGDGGKNHPGSALLGEPGPLYYPKPPESSKDLNICYPGSEAQAQPVQLWTQQSPVLSGPQLSQLYIGRMLSVVPSCHRNIKNAHKFYFLKFPKPFHKPVNLTRPGQDCPHP